VRVFAILLCLCSGAFASPTDEEAEAAARRVIESGRYQLDLPIDAPEAETREQPRTRPRRDREPDSDSTDLRDTSSSIATFLWYLLIVVVAVSLVLWGVREFSQTEQRNLQVDVSAAPAGRPARAATPLPDHARLAAAGQFDEAIHMLLLGVLRRFQGLAPAWTSREVLYKIAFPPEAREALEGLVRAVEYSHFGGVAAGEVEYRNCVKRAEICRAAAAGMAA